MLLLFIISVTKNVEDEIEMKIELNFSNKIYYCLNQFLTCDSTIIEKKHDAA